MDEKNSNSSLTRGYNVILIHKLIDVMWQKYTFFLGEDIESKIELRSKSIFFKTIFTNLQPLKTEVHLQKNRCV